MNSRLPIIKQHQRDYLFQIHVATRWSIYSLFKFCGHCHYKVWPLSSANHTLFNLHDHTVKPLLSTPQQRQKNMTAHGTLTESTEGTRGQGCRKQREHPGGGPVRESPTKCTVGFYFLWRYWEWLRAFLTARRLKDPGWKAVCDLMITNKLL